MVEVCHKGCKDVCESGDCEIKINLGSNVSMREMASLIIEILGAEEIRVVNRPRGRLLNALIEVADWFGIKITWEKDL
ncbi:hypothetical protein EYM_03925 [Ignicoccus islandicus DSM 13165]|uniref:Uncharacterized protein n=1 Tax=Ignicoccus islandicus DSM 13165 TaxID=940295 RepID=A0A0U2U8R1_9CREN|nr:hypothetical protein [Ignicoccus islandicus]ALU12452.1 hypothetical protein EYM_03925 [Ignicoccus islandicus DSM 13165]